MSEEKIVDDIQVPKKYRDDISVGNRTKQVSYFVQQHDKNKMFLELLKTFTDKQVLVLVKSKRNADILMQYLKEKEVASCAIHGNHRSSQIEEAKDDFNSKKLNILITTNRILEKISLNDVEVFVSYDLPLDASDYFKALRLVDEIGEAVALIDPEDERTLTTIEMMMRCEMTELELENFEHSNSSIKIKKDKVKKPRHKKVQKEKKKPALKDNGESEDKTTNT